MFLKGHRYGDIENIPKSELTAEILMPVEYRQTTYITYIVYTRIIATKVNNIIPWVLHNLSISWNKLTKIISQKIFSSSILMGTNNSPTNFF